MSKAKNATPTSETAAVGLSGSAGADEIKLPDAPLAAVAVPLLDDADIEVMNSVISILGAAGRAAVQRKASMLKEKLLGIIAASEAAKS